MATAPSVSTRIIGAEQRTEKVAEAGVEPARGLLDYKGRVRRYDHSKKFFTEGQPPKERHKHEEDCFCAVCRGESRRQFGTLRERMARCKATTTIIQRELWRVGKGKYEERGCKFKGTLNVPFHVVCEQLGFNVDEVTEIKCSKMDLLLLRSFEPVSNEFDSTYMEDDW